LNAGPSGCKPDALTAELTALALYCKHLSAQAGRKFALILSNRELSMRFLMAGPLRLLCAPSLRDTLLAEINQSPVNLTAWGIASDRFKAGALAGPEIPVRPRRALRSLCKNCQFHSRPQCHISSHEVTTGGLGADPPPWVAPARLRQARGHRLPRLREGSSAMRASINHNSPASADERR
jgi:hypothetical protein